MMVITSVISITKEIVLHIGIPCLNVFDTPTKVRVGDAH
jgi:hypothetical protein